MLTLQIRKLGNELVWQRTFVLSEFSCCSEISLKMSEMMHIVIVLLPSKCYH